jgi:hypothetical protein
MNHSLEKKPFSLAHLKLLLVRHQKALDFAARKSV